MSLNIMNPKQLEKQVKLVEGRIAELETEIADLEKVRAACQILLGIPVDLPGMRNAEPVTAAETKPVKPKAAKAPKAPGETAELSKKIGDLLRQRTSGMTADEIYDELKGSGLDLGGKPVQAVYTTLEKHPELFLEAENGQWRHAEEAATVAH